MRKDALILTSGGLDSTTCLAMAADEGYKLYSLTFDYGQRHRIELEKTRLIAEYFDVQKHLVIKFDMRLIGGSVLTGPGTVPVCEKEDDSHDEIPSTYVPARNLIFLSFGLAWAETLNIQDIFIGVNAVDYSGYPDCRPEFVSSFEKTANLALKDAVENRIKIRIHTPLMYMSKAEIIKTGTALGVDYGMTHSCYDPSEKGKSCGVCDSCRLRLKGFRDAGMTDPVEYVEKV